MDVFLFLFLWLALGLVGAFLVWWGEGMECPSPFGIVVFLLSCLAGPMMFLLGVFWNLADIIDRDTWFTRSICSRHKDD